MNNIRDLKRKIEATSNTSKITKAMELVSNSKKRLLETEFKNFSNYYNELEDIKDKLFVSDLKNEFLIENESKRICYLLITTDKGLVGGYNSNIYKEFNNIIKKYKNEFLLSIIGRNGYNYYKNKGLNLINDKPYSFRDDILFIDVNPLFDKLIELYKQKEYYELRIIYNNYVNPLVQEVKVEKIIPLENKTNKLESKMFYDINYYKVVDKFIPLYIKKKLFLDILNAKLSEHSSRIKTMTNANNKAKELLESYNILYNKLRQQEITNSLNDVVAGIKE